jgi:hypothetical protein
MVLPLLDMQRQVELIRAGAYSQKPKINLPTSIRPQINQTVQQSQPQTQSAGYDPKQLITYPVYRGAQIAVERIGSFFEGNLQRADAAVTNPILKQGTHFAIGFTEFLPTAFMTSAMVIPATEYILREPGRAARDFMPAQSAMVGQIHQSAVDDPARFAGGLVGMAIGTKGYAKIGGKGIGSVKKLSPFYERGMRVYSGKPNVAEVVTGKQMPWEFHYTLEGTPKNVYNPKLTVETHRYYHGTSRDFMGNIASSGVKGTTVNPQGASLRGVSGLEQALYFGAPETGYGHFVQGKGAFIKLETSVRPISKSSQYLIDMQGPGKTTGQNLMRDYYSAPKGQLIPGVKPGMGTEYLGWTEWEYMLKPGTKLYPVENIRTRAYGVLGMNRGTSFTVDPMTGRTIEILKVSTKKPVNTHFSKIPREYQPQMTSDPFADIIGKPVNTPGRSREFSLPDGGRGRVAPVSGRDLFRTHTENRGTNTARDTRADSNPFREERSRMPERDITGIRGGSGRDASRDVWGRRDYTGRGDERRIPTRLPVPERRATERIIPNQFIQITDTRVKKRKDSTETRSKIKSGSWDTFGYSEFLTNMPVNEFLGL